MDPSIHYECLSLTGAKTSDAAKLHSWRALMTHKYRGCIIVLSINKSVEPNEEQKVLTRSFGKGFTVKTLADKFLEIGRAHV